MDPILALNLVCVAVDLWLNDAELIKKRVLLEDYKVLEGMATHGTQVGYKVMANVHRKIMTIGRQWLWPVQIQGSIEYDFKLILQTVMARVLTAIEHWHDQ